MMPIYESGGKEGQQVFVQFQREDPVAVEVLPDATVGDLLDAARIPLVRATLNFAGQSTSDPMRTLAELGIGNEAVVEFVPLGPVTVQVSVWRTGQPHRIIPFVFKISTVDEFIDQLKDKIKRDFLPDPMPREEVGFPQFQDVLNELTQRGIINVERMSTEQIKKKLHPHKFADVKYWVKFA